MTEEYDIEANKALVRRAYEGPFIANDGDGIEALFSDDFVDHEPPSPGSPGGRAGVRAVMAMLATAMPDRRIEIQDLLGEGDKVAVRFTIVGTQSGPFGGRPPASTTMRLHVIAILRIEAGKIAERWGNASVR
jgi:steroid delta-isomerase-like uncharacterized protein